MLDVSLSEVEAMELRLAGSDQSLNAPIGIEVEEEWQDSLADHRPGPEEVVIGLRDAATRSRWLNEALGELTERERTIIDQRRLREETATLEALGQELGVSKERVRQIEHRAMQKLKQLVLKRAGSADRLID
jgi:RNA polymerase sigma-32 factor